MIIGTCGGMICSPMSQNWAPSLDDPGHWEIASGKFSHSYGCHGPLMIYIYILMLELPIQDGDFPWDVSHIAVLSYVDQRRGEVPRCPGPLELP